jgi:hypothetical protein
MVADHFYRIQGVISQVFANTIQFFEKVDGHSDNLAIDFVDLKNIEHFARTDPRQLLVGRGTNDFQPLGQFHVIG